MNTTVSPKVGFYAVTTVDQRWGAQTRLVDKQKRCTCGGTAERPCRHIRAVANYLREGGERAEERPPTFRPHEDNPTCPICGRPVERRDPWRCPCDPSHYWQWRGETFGVRDFLTRPHPAKQGAFYEQTIEERETFLAQAARQMHLGGYTPYS